MVAPASSTPLSDCVHEARAVAQLTVGATGPVKPVEPQGGYEVSTSSGNVYVSFRGCGDIPKLDYEDLAVDLPRGVEQTTVRPFAGQIASITITVTDKERIVRVVDRSHRSMSYRLSVVVGSIIMNAPYDYPSLVPVERNAGFIWNVIDGKGGPTLEKEDVP